MILRARYKFGIPIVLGLLGLTFLSGVESVTAKPKACILTREEQNQLNSLVPLREPIPMVVFTDPGFDVDDETALMVAASLQTRRLISLRLVVATTEPSKLRARLAKGLLKQLGLGQVPVVVGDSARPEGFDPQTNRLQAPFLASSSEVSGEAGAAFGEVLSQSPDDSVVVLVIAKMTDVNRFLHADPLLFRLKVKRVVIMGGVELDTVSHRVDVKSGVFRADERSTNNTHDQSAANEFYDLLQAMQIPTTIVTRFAAVGTPIPPSFFDELQCSGHPVAAHLGKLEGLFLNEFWQAARQGKLGEERDENWFIRSFCYPDSAPKIQHGDDIRPFLKSRVLYDAVALIAGVESLASEYFQPLNLKPDGRNNYYLVGLSPSSTGIKEPEKLAALIFGLAKEATKLP